MHSTLISEGVVFRIECALRVSDKVFRVIENRTSLILPKLAKAVAGLGCYEGVLYSKTKVEGIEYVFSVTINPEGLKLATR